MFSLKCSKTSPCLDRPFSLYFLLGLFGRVVRVLVCRFWGLRIDSRRRSKLTFWTETVFLRGPSPFLVQIGKLEYSTKIGDVFRMFPPSPLPPEVCSEEPFSRSYQSGLSGQVVRVIVCHSWGPWIDSRQGSKSKFWTETAFLRGPGSNPTEVLKLNCFLVNTKWGHVGKKMYKGYKGVKKVL